MSEEDILSFSEGRLAPDRLAGVEGHVRTCALCEQLLAAAIGSHTRSRSDEAAPLRDEPTFTLPRGTQVGRYTVVAPLGRGGMGEVYAAYDFQLDRRVALKLLRQRDDDPDGRAEARLLREARAIARLSHPNVVAIYDAGDFGERVFLAMEFVEGDTLAEWLRSAPRSLRQIREVFAACGAGLAAAHEAGLVHRDFKPQNVMVARDGSVRVMDFGLATDTSEIEPGDAAAFDVTASGPELTSRSLALTRTGVLLGTPLYMAPEQFLRRRADARTDQFSFCVSLYEALYGERPFPCDSIASLFNAVVGGHVREPPSKTRVPSYLRKLLLRGLAPDPGARYPSMQALLHALQYDPARRRRNWLVAGAVAAAAVTVAAGAQRLTTRAQRLCHSVDDRLAAIWELEPGGARRGAVHRAFLATGRAYAEDTWQRVSSLLDDYRRRWNAAYTDACEATHLRGDQSVEVMDLRMACLEGPRGALKALTDTLLQADAAGLLGAASSVLNLPALDRCSDIPALQAVVPPPADPPTRARVAELRKDLAAVKALADTGQWPEARRRAEPLVDVARSIAYPPLLVETLAVRAWLYYLSGSAAEAAKTYQKVVWTALAAHRDDIAAESAAMLTAITGYDFARIDEGERWAEVGEALVQRLGPGHDRIAAWYYQGRATFRWQPKGDYRGALADLNLALSLKRKALGPNHPDVAITLYSMSAIQNDMGDHQAALASANQAVEICRSAYGPESPLSAQALGFRGQTLRLLKRYAESERDLRRAVDLTTSWVGVDHPWTAEQMTHLGETIYAQGRFVEAASILERALRARERVEPNPTSVAETRFALAQANAAAGRDRSGSRALAVAARDAYRTAGQHPEMIAEIDEWLARTAHQNGKTKH